METNNLPQLKMANGGVVLMAIRLIERALQVVQGNEGHEENAIAISFIQSALQTLGTEIGHVTFQNATVVDKIEPAVPTINQTKAPTQGRTTKNSSKPLVGDLQSVEKPRRRQRINRYADFGIRKKRQSKRKMRRTCKNVVRHTCQLCSKTMCDYSGLIRHIRSVHKKGSTEEVRQVIGPEPGCC